MTSSEPKPHKRSLINTGMQIFLAYLLTAFLFFGSPLKPLHYVLQFAFYGKFMVHMLYIAASIIFGFVLTSTIIQYKSVQNFIPNALKKFAPGIATALFICISILLATVSTGLTRRIAVAKLAPDAVILKPYLFSLHQASNELQFFTHAIAIKDCTPYNWSYGQMGFYKLSPNIAINLFPQKWIQQCNIKRD